MRRYYTPSFQTQFQAFTNEPKKQKQIIDAIDRFQRLRADASYCRQIYAESEQLFQLDADRGVKIIAGLYPFAEVPDLGVFLFVGQEPEVEMQA